MKPIAPYILNGVEVQKAPNGTIGTRTVPAIVGKVDASPIVQGNKKSPNPHSYEVMFCRLPKGVNKNWNSMDALTNVYSGDIAFDSNHPFLNGQAFPPHLYNEVLDKLNEKARGGLDLAVDLAQAGQTMRMLRASENATTFVKLFRGWRGLINGVSSIRLAYVYGWKPLAQDIWDAANLGIEVALGCMEHFKARCSEEITSTPESFTIKQYGACPGQCERKGRHTAEMAVSLTTLGHDPSKWTSLNPASIAWELVPYSFVLDWIVDVGSYIRNFETSLLYNNRFVNGYYTTGTHFDATWEASAYREELSWGVYQYYSVDASASFRYRKLQRIVLTSYPAPRLPMVKAELGSGRLLNLAALIGGKMKIRNGVNY